MGRNFYIFIFLYADTYAVMIIERQVSLSERQYMWKTNNKKFKNNQIKSKEYNIHKNEIWSLKYRKAGFDWKYHIEWKRRAAESKFGWRDHGTSFGGWVAWVREVRMSFVGEGEGVRLWLLAAAANLVFEEGIRAAPAPAPWRTRGEKRVNWLFLCGLKCLELLNSAH